MRETTKDFPIEGRTYRVEKLSAMDGTWLWFFFSARMKTADIRDALAAISEEQFRDISAKLLAKCFYMNPESGLPIPVRNASTGMIVDEVLASDPTALFDLIFQAIGFNISPFLEKAAQEAARAKAEAEKSQRSETRTPGSAS